MNEYEVQRKTDEANAISRGYKIINYPLWKTNKQKYIILTMIIFALYLFLVACIGYVIGQEAGISELVADPERYKELLQIAKIIG